MDDISSVIILGAIVAAAAMVWLVRRYTRRKAVEAALLGVYTNLLDLYGYYFWLVSAVNKEDPEIHEKVKMLKRIILGYLPKINHLSFTREIRDLLEEADTPKHSAAAAKYRALEAILKRIEAYIGKHHLAVPPKILQSNIQLESRINVQEDEDSNIYNAPGFINWVPRKNKK